MKQLYRRRLLYCMLMLCNGTISCHQDPAVPQSAIPAVCRIYQLITINEGARDTTTYYYNKFGLVEKSTYRKWVNGQLLSKTDQSYTYTADYYLFSQIDQTSTRAPNGTLVQQNKGYAFTYQDGLIQEIAINDNLTNAKLGYRNYTYENNQLKTYEERNGSKGMIKRYTFDNGGKLINYEEPNSNLLSVQITKGKIVSRLFRDSTQVSYEYDNEGQVTLQTTISPSGKSQYAYSYDSKPYWNKTQLLLRGIPSPDLGEHMPVHNLITSTYRIYQNGQVASEQKLILNHAYTKEGYSLGYGRSDGMRQINYYSNCL